eukprot:COSAG04_NODE_1855_length_5385_cov_4.796443_4_plen_90_part_00
MDHQHIIGARDALRKVASHPVVHAANAVRQRDSGLKQVVRDLGDPAVKVKQWSKEWDHTMLPPSVKALGNAGLFGMREGVKLGKWLGGR